MTTDRWAKAREAKARIAASRKAEVSTTESNLKARPVTDTEMFVAQNQYKSAPTTLAVHDEEMAETGETIAEVRKRRPTGRVIIEHNGPGMRTMFKKTPAGWVPRPVNSNLIGMLVDEGWLPYCGDCGEVHGGNPNDCPAREPKKYGRCPVCNNPIYDDYEVSQEFQQAMKVAADDPNLMVFEEFGSSTPESRVRKAIEEHMYYKHPRSAREWSIQAPAEPPEDLLSMAQKRI